MFGIYVHWLFHDYKLKGFYHTFLGGFLVTFQALALQTIRTVRTVFVIGWLFSNMQQPFHTISAAFK